MKAGEEDEVLIGIKVKMKGRGVVINPPETEETTEEGEE